MKRIFTLVASSLLLIFATHGQVSQSAFVTSSGGNTTVSGTVEHTAVLGDPSAASGVATGSNIQLFSGFIRAHFISNEATEEGVLEKDSLALVDVFNQTGGTQWTTKTNWLTGKVKDWYGVLIDGNRVISVKIPKNNLIGTLPSSISNMEKLVFLDLSGNEISKNMPDEIGLLVGLKELNFSANDFGGQIPIGLSNLRLLTHLDLSQNRLIGSIPKLSGITNLEVLRLGQNELTGVFPDSLNQLKNLRELDLSFNQLTGVLPSTIGGISSIRFFSIGNNHFSGDFPQIAGAKQLRVFSIENNDLGGSMSFLSGSDSLKEVRIDQNSISTFPDLSAKVFQLTQVKVEFNQLDFGDIEPNKNLVGFTYSPQDSIGEELDTLMEEGKPIQFYLDVEGSSNVYQWLFNNDTVVGENTDTYSISAANSANEGQYILQIANEEVDDLVLISQPFELSVSSRKRDSLSLVDIYQKTGGTGWTNSSNWLSGSLNTWQGVTFNANGTRVVGLNLSEKGLKGDMPISIRRIGNLTNLNLSKNKLSSFPNVSSLKLLTTLNLSANNLSFGDLQPNKDIANFTYSPQGVYGQTKIDTIQAGEDAAVIANVPGRSNQYQWYFGESKIDGATLPQHIITEIDFYSMGNYVAEVTNGDLPGLTIKTANQQALAADDVHGRIELDQSGNLLTAGRVDLFRIKDGPFDSAGTAPIDSNGYYVVRRVVLGDFVMKIDPADEFDTVLQTYYVSQTDWLRADTLRLRQKTEGINIRMQKNPGIFEINDDNTGVIGGFLEEDIDNTDSAGARIDTRRRVKKAGCSLQRRTQSGGGRTEDDVYVLVAYIETDDQGLFNFVNIPNGEYRLNIQYPGVPMDESSAIDFIIGAGGDIENSTFQLEALITETGIVVGLAKATGNLKPWLKDVWLYPNPTQGKLTFDYRVYRPMDGLKATLLDISGATHMSMELGYSLGYQRAELDVTALPAGLYFLVLSNGQGVVSNSIKIVKQ